MFFHHIAIFYLVFNFYQNMVLGRQYAECDSLDKFNTFVASRQSCAKYIFCDGVNSFEGECLGDNYFNELEGNCDDRNAVICHLDSNNENDKNEVKVTGTIMIESNNNSANSDHGKNANEFNLNQEINVNQSTELSSNSINSTSTLPNTNGLPGLFNSMPNLPSDFLARPQCALNHDSTNLMHLPNPTSCTSYYTCYNGIAVPMLCDLNMHFNPATSKCEPQELVNCARDRPSSQICLKGMNEFMPHPGNCDYYYFCSNGFLMIFQCPFKYSWDYERRSCVPQSLSKCFSRTVKEEVIIEQNFSEYKVSTQKTVHKRFN